jgi:branched-chain amino acid transport system ATP-binding protein
LDEGLLLDSQHPTLKQYQDKPAITPRILQEHAFMAMLEVNDINTYYGNIHALKGISLSVDEGEIVTLIGANGAGKTTTLRTISGLIRPTTGNVIIEGEDISKYPAHQMVYKGIAMVPEGRGVFSRLTVQENMDMGAFSRNDRQGIQHDLDRVFTLFPRLKERRKQVAGTLSGGEQQMLATGRALMSHPRLLLMDEPSMGLAPILVESIFETIQDINKEGTTILLVEQNATMALSVANRGYVLQTGEIVLKDTADNLRKNEMVKKAYLGIE